MDKTKLSNILASMAKNAIHQLLISDPAVIFYLTGTRMEPGERESSVFHQRPVPPAQGPGGSHYLL